MRIATERVELVDSITSTQSRMAACSEALHLSNKLVRGTAAVVVGVLGFATALLCRRKKKDVAATMVLSPQVGAGRFVAAKLVSMLVIPWLQKVFVGAPPKEEKKKSGGVLGFVKRVLFRRRNTEGLKRLQENEEDICIRCV